MVSNDFFMGKSFLPVRTHSGADLFQSFSMPKRKSLARIARLFVPPYRGIPFGIPIAVRRGVAVISGLSERKEVPMMARRIILLVAFFLVFGAGFRIYALPAVCGSPDSLTRTEAASPAGSDPFERNDYMAGVNEQDPARQAILLEDFQRRYPESVVRAGPLHKTLDDDPRSGGQTRWRQRRN